MAKKILYVNFNLKEAQDGAKVFTKAGQPVKIFYNKELGEYPIVGILFYKGVCIGDDGFHGFDKAMCYDINGRCFNSDGFNNNDLVIGVEVEDKDENKKTAIQEGNMCEMKLIPFDAEKAKAGAQVITRNGRPVTICRYDVKNKDYPILGLVELVDGKEVPQAFTESGKSFNGDDQERPFDLFIKVETKLHRMTYQEFTWWLRECPEEHREYCYKGGNSVHFNYYYTFDGADEEVEEGILIRKNGGEWMAPVIEE